MWKRYLILARQGRKGKSRRRIRENSRRWSVIVRTSVRTLTISSANWLSVLPVTTWSPIRGGLVFPINDRIIAAATTAWRTSDNKSARKRTQRNTNQWQIKDHRFEPNYKLQTWREYFPSLVNLVHCIARDKEEDEPKRHSPFAAQHWLIEMFQMKPCWFCDLVGGQLSLVPQIVYKVIGCVKNTHLTHQTWKYHRGLIIIHAPSHKLHRVSYHY